MENNPDKEILKAFVMNKEMFEAVRRYLTDISIFANHARAFVGKLPPEDYGFEVASIAKAMNMTDNQLNALKGLVPDPEPTKITNEAE